MNIMNTLFSFIKIDDVIRKSIDMAIMGLGYEIPSYLVTVNPNQKFGDYSTNSALLIASQVKASPAFIASEIVKSIVSEKIPVGIKDIKAESNGFINFFISDELLVSTIEYVLKEGSPFGNFASDDQNTYIVEYSSPNMVKPFTVGYLRSTILGEAIANILSYSGKRVVKDNHLGDWGVQYGKLIAAIHTWSSREVIQSSDNPYLELINLYLRYIKAEREGALSSDKAIQEYQKLEQGDVVALEEWGWIRDVLIQGLNNIYGRLGIIFDVVSWESLFVKDAHKVVDSLVSLGIAEISDGATVVFFEELPPLLLKKGDGTSLYASRELACDIARKMKYGDRLVIINEVGSDQKVYFEQIFSVEDKMNLFDHSQRIHLKHGMYKLEGMKMVSENGNYILLEDVLNFAKDKVLNKFPEMADSDAEIIGQAMIRFNDLKNPPTTDVVFDVHTFTSIGKGSGPYIQYVIHKARRVNNKDFDLKKERVGSLNDEERTVIRHLQKGYKYFENSQKELSTHHVANFASELAFLYNSYHAQAILNPLSVNLIFISKCTEKMLTICLSLLGIKVPEKI